MVIALELDKKQKNKENKKMRQTTKNFEETIRVNLRDHLEFNFMPPMFGRPANQDLLDRGVEFCLHAIELVASGDGDVAIEYNNNGNKLKAESVVEDLRLWDYIGLLEMREAFDRL